MSLKSTFSLLEKIEEFSMESQEAHRQVEKLEELRKEFLGIHAKYEDLFADKYGENRRKLKKTIEFRDLERIMHLIRAENSQPPKTGFLGLGGMKKEEYLSLTDKLNLVESNLTKMEEEWSAYLEGQVDSLAYSFKKQEDRYVACKSKWGKAINLTPEKMPTGEKNDLLVIGEYLYEVPQDRHVQKMIKEKKYCFCDVDVLKMRAVATITLPEPECLCVLYEKEGQQEKIYNWIRNMVIQIMAQVPVYQYEFIYLDALNNAGGLKELLNLQYIRADYTDRIDTQLDGEGIRALRVGRDNESIRRELIRLEKYMGMVTDALQGKVSLTENNRAGAPRIPYKIVVLEGISTGTENSLVKKLILNGRKCGIFVILLQESEKYPGSLPDKYKNEWSFLLDSCHQIIYRESGTYLKYVAEKEERAIILYDSENDFTGLMSGLKEKPLKKREIDNSFSVYFPDNYIYGKLTSTTELPSGKLEGRICIPYAVDQRGDIVSLEIGSASYAHGLLSGSTGSGKSTAYHMFINSIAMNYHPDDVELWLIDYKKVEFSTYIVNRPPHIRFLGIERNQEFTFSFLDLLYGEYERRMDLFADSNVTNIDKYKKTFGVNSLARILVLIDEFHIMAQQVEDDPDYARKLENLLSEARGTGIAFLFADQSVSTGLRGLTAKGKKQLRLRLAMANDMEEIRETLDTKISESQAVLDSGEIWNKKIIKRMREDGTEERSISLELDKVIYISDRERIKVAQKANALYGTREAIIVDGNKEAVIDWEIAQRYEKEHDDGREKRYLHLGKPSNLDSCFAIALIKDYGQNVISIHSDHMLQQRNLMNVINSFARQPEDRIYVMADSNDALFCQARKELLKIKGNPNIYIRSDYVDICQTVLGLHRELEDRRRHRGNVNILVVWLGLESVMREAEGYDKPLSGMKKEVIPKKNEISDLTEMMLQKFNSCFGETLEESSGNRITGEEEEILYNVADQIIDLFSEGSKRGIFQAAFFSDILSLKHIKMIKLENFKYRMSGYMNKDSCYEYYGAYKFMDGLKDAKGMDNMVVCHNGNKARFFIPYLPQKNEQGGKQS